MQTGNSFMSGSDGLSIAHELVLEMEARSSASQSATTYSPSISFDTTQSTYSDHQSSGLEIYQLAGEQRFNQLTPQSNHIAFNTQNYLFDTGQQIQQIVLTQEPSLANSQTILQSPSNEVSSLAFSPLARPASQNQSFPSIAQTSWQPTIYEYVAAAPNQSYNNSLPATAAQQQYMMQAAPASQQLVSANNKLLASQLASQQSFQTAGGVYANVAPSVVDFILPKAQPTATANPSQSQQMFGSYAAASGSFSQNCAHPSSAQIGVVGGQSAARTPTPLSPSGVALTAHANANAAALRQPALTGASLATAFTAHSQAGNCFDNYAVLEPQLAVQVPQSLPVRTRLRTTLDAYAGPYGGSEQHQHQQQPQQSQQVAQRASTQASIPFRLPVTYPQRPAAATLVLDPSYWSTGSISTSTSTPAAASAASASLTAAGALVEHFNPPVNYQSSSPAGLSASASLVAPIPIAVAAHSHTHTHTHTRTHTHSHTQTQTSRVDPAAFAFVAAPSNVPVPAPAPPLPQSPAASSVDSPGTEFQTKRRRETPSESASASATSANIANANANTSTSGQRRSSRATPIAVGEAYPTMRPLLDDRIAAILGDPNPLQPPNLSMSTTRVSPSNNLSACGGGSHSEPGSDPFSVLAPLLSHPTPPSIATDASASTGNCDTGNGTGTASSPTAKLSYASASDVRPEQLFDVLDHRFASSANAQSDADANDETAAADRPEEEQHADQLTLFVDTPESSVTMTITERKRAYESIRGVKIRKRPAPSPSAIRIHSQSPNQAVSLSLPSATSPRVAIPNKKPRGRPPKVSQVASRFPASLSTSSSSSSSRASTPMPDARQNESQRPPADAMASASTFSRAATASRKESASSDDTSDFSLTPPSVASIDADGVELVGVESASPVRKRAATKSSAIAKPQGEAAVERSHSSHVSAFASISSQSLQRSKRALDSPSAPPATAGQPPAQHQTQRSANNAAAAVPGASLKSPKAVSSGASASPEKPRAVPTPKAPKESATPKSPAAASATSRPQVGAPSHREKEKERLQLAHPSREQPTPSRALATPEAALRDPKKSQSPRPAPVSSSASAITSNSASLPATATASQLKVHSSSSGGSGRGSASAASSGVGEGSSSSTSNRSAGASTQVKKVLVNIILRVDSVTVIYSYLSHFLVLKCNCCCLVQST